MSDLRTELTAIYERHGRLTAKVVVSEAAAPDHPLHDRFEWDDAVAGDKYRRQQARELIRSVLIKREAAQPRVRAFHSIGRADRRSYEPIEVIIEDPFSRTILLRQAERDWRALRRRYKHLVEFFDQIREELDRDAGAA